MYIWIKNYNGGGPYEVVSALLNFLQKRIKAHPNVTNLKLFSDACPGQNCNRTTMLVLLMFDNDRRHKFTDIKYYFPVRKHSFLPPNRILRPIEKLISKREKMILPEEYHDLFQQNTTVYSLRHDWKIFDYKNLQLI